VLHLNVEISDLRVNWLQVHYAMQRVPNGTILEVTRGGALYSMVAVAAGACLHAVAGVFVSEWDTLVSLFWPVESDFQLLF
jgi:hypothetical protein